MTKLARLALVLTFAAPLLLAGCVEWAVDPDIQACRDAGGVPIEGYQHAGITLERCEFPCGGRERFRPGFVPAEEPRP